MITIDSSALPVRKVSVFGYAAVIPKDAVCLVHLKYDTGRENGGWVRLDITVEIKHTFLTKGALSITLAKKYEGGTSSLLRGLFTKKLLGAMRGTDYPWEVVWRSAKWKVAAKKIKEQKIRDTILDMFLDGTVVEQKVRSMLPL